MKPIKERLKREPRNNISFKFGKNSRKAKEIAKKLKTPNGNQAKIKRNNFTEESLPESPFDSQKSSPSASRTQDKNENDSENVVPGNHVHNTAISPERVAHDYAENWTDNEPMNEEVNYNHFDEYGYEDPTKDSYQVPPINKKSTSSPPPSILEDPIKNTWFRDAKDKSDVTRENEFLEDAWKTGFRKDILALNAKINGFEVKFKVHVRQCKKKQIHQLPNYEDEEDFASLPNFPLKKKKRFLAMVESIETNRDFKKQMVEKLAFIGGTSIKNCVINIFNGIFTPKLRSKICWKGSTAGAGKIAFHPFKGLRNVLRQAVSRSHKCTRSNIDAECQLRFKQADKDYEREKQKLNKL